MGGGSLKINPGKDQNTAAQTFPIQAEKYAVKPVILGTEKGRRGGREVAAAAEGEKLRQALPRAHRYDEI